LSRRFNRLLDVKSLTNRPDYYVVELDDPNGSSVARVAITKDGTLMHVQPSAPEYTEPRSTDLKEANAIAGRFASGSVRSARYVYIDNVAEIGNPVLTPLIQVDTAAGRIYLNSRQEAFAEENSSLDRVQRDQSAAAPVWRGALNLRKLTPQ
jgi:hypothetical protein